MKKIILFFLIALVSEIGAQTQTSEISSRTGAFSRTGFGARGMAMGNALSSVTEGSLVAYYNPALSVFQNGNSAQVGYTFLSFDRTLNFLSFTRKFELGVKVDENGVRSKPRSVAGISAGIINAGVSNIDGRDNQGLSTGDISTSENQFFIGVANKFSDHFSLGIEFKFYYFSLVDKVSANGIGFDVGALIKPIDNLNISLVITDINSKYKWDTTPVYGQNGSNTTVDFPLLSKVGISYKFVKQKLLVAAELQHSNAGTNYIRLGAEYNLYKNLNLRGGLDRFNLSNTDEPVRPSAGFSYAYKLNSFIVGIEYAFVMEPYSGSDKHIVGVNFNF